MRLSDRIRFLCPAAKLIFALTTSVVEPGFAPGESVGKRCNEDIIRFNEIARQILKERVDAINDLWTISMNLPDTARSDGVHFGTALGIEKLGGKAAESILDCLG